MTDTEKAYRMIFEAMKERFGEAWYRGVDWSVWGVVWRHHIKTQLFDHDIIAPEAIAVIGDVDKRYWPRGTGFFARVRDMALVQRKEKHKAVEMNHGFESLSDLL